MFCNDDGGRNNKDMDPYKNNCNHDDANVKETKYNNTTQNDFAELTQVNSLVTVVPVDNEDRYWLKCAI